MERDVSGFLDKPYDMVVIGAGIHGACVAMEGSLRGLRVALVDRGDFGNATSHNSLKLIHGGLRYLQHAEFGRVRSSIAESRFWLRAAPDLVRPLKVVIPTYGYGTRGPIALRAALAAHRLLGAGLGPESKTGQTLPPGSLISKRECQSLIPGIDTASLSGGAVWYDGQMVNSDAVLLRCIRAAADAGAEVANYVEVTNLRAGTHGIEGVLAVDRLTGREFEIRARVTVNCCGPWIDCLLQRSGQPRIDGRGIRYVKSMNLVTRSIFPDYAVGVSSNELSDASIGRSRRLYFITPWQGRSLIGTTATAYTGDPDDCSFSESEIEDFIADINAAYPPAALERKDVLYCYGGLTPASEDGEPGASRRARRPAIIDHLAVDGVAGLISVVGIKYTTARGVAEQAVNAVCTRLNVTPPARDVHSTPLLQTESADDRAIEDGSPDGVDARCEKAVRDDMAVHLADVIFRRMDLVARGLLSHDDFVRCADIMANTLGWDRRRKSEELAQASSEALNRHARIAAPSNLMETVF